MFRSRASEIEHGQAIDLICDQFEKAINSGANVRLKGYLSQIAPEARQDLLVELLQVAFSVAFAKRQACDVDAFLLELPEYETTIREAEKRFRGSPSQANLFEPGDRFSEYTIECLLGCGAHSLVYRAFDETLKRTIALKVVHGDLHAELAKRFVEEAQTVAGIDLRGVCSVFAIGESEGLQFIAMRYVEGETLKEHLRDLKLSPDQSVDLVRRIAGIMSQVHRKGVYHRDLKPANIIIEKDSMEPVITDFGLAYSSRDEQHQVLPRVSGTPAYMPPEAFSSGDVELTPAHDIFSLGVILYELLAGRRPTRTETGAVRADLASCGVLARTVGRAIEDDPEKRFSAMNELAMALHAESLQQTRKASRYGLGTVSVLVLISVVVVTLLIRGWRPMTPTIATRSGESALASSGQGIRADQTFDSVALQLGVVRPMPGQQQLLWMLDTNLEAVFPRREIDFSFADAETTRYVLSGRWEPHKATTAAAISVHDRELHWHFMGGQDQHLVFGREGDIPLAGDWSGNGWDELIVARRGGITEDADDGRWHWIVRSPTATTPKVDLTFMRASEGDIPLIGTWDPKDGCPRPVLVRPNRKTGVFDWYFYGNEKRPRYSFGAIDSVPMTADFDGDGNWDFASIRPGKIELVWRVDVDRDGEPDIQHPFGLPEDKLVTGTWSIPEARVTPYRRDEIYPSSTVSLPYRSELSFEVQNTGTAPLHVGHVKVVSGDFVVTKQVEETSLERNATTNFRIAHSGNTVPGVVTFSTNDPNEYDFRFHLKATREKTAAKRFSEWRGAQLKEQRVTLPGLNADAKFGQSIATTEGVLVVTAPGFTRDAERTGKVYAAQFHDGEFVSIEELLVDPVPGRGFGEAVDAFHDTIVVGSPQDNGEGSAYVFATSAENKWKLLARLRADQIAGHKFGSSVAIWGDTIVVGSFADSCKVNDELIRWAGSAHVFLRDQNGPNQWGLVESITAMHPKELHRFGYSVDVSETYIVVGSSPDANCDGPAVTVFSRQLSGAKSWHPLKTFEQRRDRLNNKTAYLPTIKQSMLIIGTTPTPKRMRVHNARPVNLDEWHPLSLGSPADGYRWGTTTSLSDDSLHMIATAHSIADGLPSRVFLLSRDNVNSPEWKQICEMSPSQRPTNTFGVSLAFLGETICVGDPGLNVVYAFSLPDEGIE